MIASTAGENGSGGNLQRGEQSRIRAVDAKRRDYYQYYSGNEWGKPKNYDLCLNSGTLGIERCVEIIANSVTLE